MIVTLASKRDPGVARATNATWTGDGTAGTVKLGFNPNMLTLVNETDASIYTKYGTQAAANCIKTVTAGTTTVDTTSQVLFNGDGTVTIAAATNIAAKVFHLFAE